MLQKSRYTQDHTQEHLPISASPQVCIGTVGNGGDRDRGACIGMVGDEGGDKISSGGDRGQAGDDGGDRGDCVGNGGGSDAGSDGLA